VKSVYEGIMNLAVGADLTTAIANDILLPGSYFHGLAFPLAAGRNVTFTGGADDIWIIRIEGATAIAGNFKLAGGARESNIFWAVSGAFGLGAKSICYGTVFSPAAISIAAGAKFYGRLFSTMGACDIAELALVETASATTDNIAYDPLTFSVSADDDSAISVEPSDGREVSASLEAAPNAGGPIPMIPIKGAVPTSEPFPFVEVMIAVSAFLVLLGVGIWYRLKLRHAANSKVLAVDEATEV
jgi:hypothetical protein